MDASQAILDIENRRRAAIGVAEANARKIDDLAGHIAAITARPCTRVRGEISVRQYGDTSQNLNLGLAGSLIDEVLFPMAMLT